MGLIADRDKSRHVTNRDQDPTSWIVCPKDPNEEAHALAADTIEIYLLSGSVNLHGITIGEEKPVQEAGASGVKPASSPSSRLVSSAHRRLHVP